MILQLDVTSKTPLYQQLMDRIIEAIVKGTLKNGDMLPSVRQLAGELGINLHTVNKAYRVLEKEGYVTAQQRRGVMVTGKSKADAEYTEDFYLRMRTLMIEAYSKGITVQTISQQMTDILDELNTKRQDEEND